MVYRYKSIHFSLKPGMIDKPVHFQRFIVYTMTTTVESSLDNKRNVSLKQKHLKLEHSFSGNKLLQGSRYVVDVAVGV